MVSQATDACQYSQGIEIKISDQLVTKTCNVIKEIGKLWTDTYMTYSLGGFDTPFNEINFLDCCHIKVCDQLSPKDYQQSNLVLACHLAIQSIAQCSKMKMPSGVIIDLMETMKLDRGELQQGVERLALPHAVHLYPELEGIFVD